MDVTALLGASRGHHANYQRAQRLKDYVTAEREVAHALDLRLQAHTSDPGHTDAAWAIDTVSHDALVAFYRLYPSIA